MALGALIALGIVLWRGDLCPGQRSRITNQLFSIWVITGLSLMLGIEAGVTGWLPWCGGAALILGALGGSRDPLQPLAVFKGGAQAAETQVRAAEAYMRKGA